MSDNCPKHIRSRLGITSRQWKGLKRQELRDMNQAWHSFRAGCSYVPGYDKEIIQIEEALKSLKKKMSVSEWGS